ncbi:hypothetical protein GCM10010422_45740 [Streptomyces graminearus]|uniref:Uncharacterized protein n=1 Tax=Streptomyces graminearus TaxID=284030 RepID=A0ABN3M1A0_9ACTN
MTWSGAPPVRSVEVTEVTTYLLNHWSSESSEELPPVYCGKQRVVLLSAVGSAPKSQAGSE